jgi:hypothetical protein
MHRLLPLLAVVVLVAACGGSSSKRLSHEELVTKADEICTVAHAAVAKVKPPTKAGDVLPALDAALANGERELGQLRALKPSAADAKAYAGLLTRLQRTIQLTRRARNAVKAKQTLRAQVLIQVAVRSNTEAQAYAGGFGLQVCSKPVA